MNPNLLGIISAILAFVAFLLVYNSSKDKPLSTRLVFMLLAVLAAVPSVSYTAYYIHILPELSWYYQFRSILGTELLVIFIGISGGLIATFLPRSLLILPLAGTAILITVPIIKPFIGPIPNGALQDKWNRGVCLQSTGSTCGPASTATIINFLGGKTTESELAKEAHSYAGGTEAWFLARSARSRGYDVEFDFTTGFSPEKGLPAVVGVQLTTNGHFIAIISQDGDRFTIGDPLRGYEILTRDELLKRYTFTGFHMRIK